MEKIIENSKRYIIKKFPEVMIIDTAHEIIFEGRFIFEARQGIHEIHVAPLLKIIMSKQYPDILPVCYDIDKKIQYDHIFSDNSLCVSTTLDLGIGLKNSQSIQDFIEKFVIPFFLSYKYWQQTGIDLNGDRSHGSKGVFESLYEYLFPCDLTENEMRYLLCWASKTKKFKKCIPMHLQKEFLHRNIRYVEKLRNVGISILRQQYKVLIQTRP